MMSIMTSPFALAPKDPAFFELLKPIEESRLMRMRYLHIHLRYKNTITASQSQQLYSELLYNKLRKKHKYHSKAGILMIENKKPFSVRFDDCKKLLLQHKTV